MKGRMVQSKAGHDAGELYIIVGQENENVILADGVTRTLQKPKKKNKKHIEIVMSEPAMEITQDILEKKRSGDEAVRRKIAEYRKHI